MWSSVSIPGSPRTLMVDATQNVQGWEYAFADRLYQSLKKTGLLMEEDKPLHIKHATDVNRLNDYEFNCLLLLAYSPTDILSVLRSLHHSPYLLAICGTDGFDTEASELILKSDVAPFVVTPMSSMTAREAGLFYLKFFTELKLHSSDVISGKMVWFSFSKARELLKRRRYTSKFGVRC